MPRVALLGQVIVSGEPKAEIQLFVQLLKEIGQPVLGIIPLFEQLLLHFCGKAVADYHINIPVHMLQCLSGMLQLRFGGEFFRPPRHACPAVFFVTAFCTAHGEDAAVFQLKYLSAAEMKNVRRDLLDFAAVPFRGGICMQSVKILVVAVHP